MYPPALQALVDLFAGLSESERRELLIHYARGSSRHAPQPGEVFDLEDVRHDAECTDTVGIHLRISEEDRCHFRISLGPEVQTLTRALTSILCESLDGTPVKKIACLPDTFIEQIAGATLVRLRSRTVYYVLKRMKESAHKWMQRHCDPNSAVDIPQGY